MIEKQIKVPCVDGDRYRGQWVALHPDTHEVVASGSSLQEAEREAIQRGVKKPLMFAVPESDAFFVGSSQS